MPFASKERLRDKPPGRRPIVLVGIVDVVRVEVQLAIVEVEVRRVVPADLGIRMFAFARPWHRS